MWSENSLPKGRIANAATARVEAARPQILVPFAQPPRPPTPAKPGGRRGYVLPSRPGGLRLLTKIVVRSRLREAAQRDRPQFDQRDVLVDQIDGPPQAFLRRLFGCCEFRDFAQCCRLGRAPPPAESRPEPHVSFHSCGGSGAGLRARQRDDSAPNDAKEVHDAVGFLPSEYPA